MPYRAVVRACHLRRDPLLFSAVQARHRVRSACRYFYTMVSFHRIQRKHRLCPCLVDAFFDITYKTFVHLCTVAGNYSQTRVHIVFIECKHAYRDAHGFLANHTCAKSGHAHEVQNWSMRFTVDLSRMHLFDVCFDLGAPGHGPAGGGNVVMSSETGIVMPDFSKPCFYCKFVKFSRNRFT